MFGKKSKESRIIMPSGIGVNSTVEESTGEYILIVTIEDEEGDVNLVFTEKGFKDFVNGMVQSKEKFDKDHHSI